MLPRLYVFGCGFLFVCLSGCAVWKKKTDPDMPLLPGTRMSSDSVVLEIAFVYVPRDARSLVELTWQDLDEQHLPLEVRSKLNDNGIRCGVAGVQLPRPLQELLEHQDNRRQVDSELGAPRIGKTAGLKRIQSRAGLRNEIITSPQRRQMTMMISEEGKLKGETCYQATCKMIVRTFPQGDGRVKFELMPEVHHGEPRPNFVGGENAFRIEMSQQKQVIELLGMETTLSLGQTLVLGATENAIGLGARFFTDESMGKPQPKLILIRLAQTQYDDLFAQDKIDARVATPME